MSDKPSENPEEMAVHVIALKNFERVLRALNEAAERVEAGELEAVKSARDGTVDLRKAVQVVFDERKRVNDIAKSGDTDGEETELDFDTARREIQGRLDRLSRR